MEFASMTWRQYILKRRGYNIKRSYEFEHTRAIAYYSCAPHSEQINRIGLHEFWPLMTDGKVEVRGKKSKEDIERAYQMIRDRHKKENDILNGGCK